MVVQAARTRERGPLQYVQRVNEVNEVKTTHFEHSLSLAPREPIGIALEHRLESPTDDRDGGRVALAAFHTLDPLEHGGRVRLVEGLVGPARVGVGRAGLRKRLWRDPGSRLESRRGVVYADVTIHDGVVARFRGLLRWIHHCLFVRTIGVPVEDRRRDPHK